MAEERVGAEIGCLGKVINIFPALRSKDFKLLDERMKGKAWLCLLGGLIDQATSYQQ